jgi:hypothetical protein
MCNVMTRSGIARIGKIARLIQESGAEACFQSARLGSLHQQQQIVRPVTGNDSINIRSNYL